MFLNDGTYHHHKLQIIVHEKPLNILFVFFFELEFSNTVGELPEWHPGPLTLTCRLIPPCIRAMTNYTKHKLSGDSWYSPPFYTGPGGYKLQLRVDADGSSTAKDTHVSVCVYLMKGENDDCLGWPYKGSVTVKLLNWIEDENHLEHPFSTTSAADPQSFSRVTSGVRAPGEMCRRHFIAHKKLEFDSEKTTQYMMEDVLCFEISPIEIFSSELIYKISQLLYFISYINNN